MPAVHSYLACDLATGKVRDRLVLSGVSYERVLNLPGSFQGTLSRTASTSLRSVISEDDTLLVALRGNVVAWGGIVTSLESTGTGGISVGATGLRAYYDRRFLAVNTLNEDVDETEIVAGYVDYITAHHGIPMTVDPMPTGRLRTRHTVGAERPYVGDLLKALTEVENGPDINIRLDETRDLDGTRQFVATMQVRAMQGGETEFSLKWGKNLVDYTVTYPGGTITWAEATNDAQDESRPIITKSLPAPIRYDGIITRSGVTLEDTLAAWAQRLLDLYGAPAPLVAVQVDPRAKDPRPGDVSPGDRVGVEIANGYDNIAARHRVYAVKTEVADSGTETLSLAFIEPSVESD